MLKKICIVALTTIGIAAVITSPASARGWHHGGGFGPGFVGGLALGAAVGAAPYYGGYYGPGYYYGGGPYAYAPGCFLHRQVVWRHGYRVVRRVRVCE